jgi:methyl-accepting chemotaxis protein
MSKHWKTWLPALALASTTLTPASGVAEGASQRAAARAEEAAAAARVDERAAQDQEISKIANDFALEASAVLEHWLESGAIKEERLFARLYYPIVNTEPTKYSTDYDALADRDLGPVLEKFVGRSPAIQYAIVTDVNGYVPTHNRQFSKPLTGNRAVDLVNNRSKRIFGDTVGFNAARHQGAVLIQHYARDTSETLADLSLPLRVRGKHFGCVRIGYRRAAP